MYSINKLSNNCIIIIIIIIIIMILVCQKFHEAFANFECCFAVLMPIQCFNNNNSITSQLYNIGTSCSHYCNATDNVDCRIQIHIGKL